MFKSNDRPQKPVVFVNATQVVKDKDDGSQTSYVRSITVDLDEVKKNLGTKYAQIKVMKRKNPKKPEDRLIIIEASEERYLPKKREEDNNYGSPHKNDDDNLL